MTTLWIVNHFAAKYYKQFISVYHLPVNNYGSQETLMALGHNPVPNPSPNKEEVRTLSFVCLKDSGNKNCEHKSRRH